MGARGVFFRVSGRVQGVAYRAFTRRAADENGITGWVRNRSDGDVEGEAHGDTSGLELFFRRLQEGPPLARVDGVSQREISARQDPDFQIRY